MNKNNLWKLKLRGIINNYKYLLMAWKHCLKKNIKAKRDMFKQNWQLISVQNRSSHNQLQKNVEKHNNNSEWSNIFTYILAPILCLLFGLWAAFK